MPGDGSPGVTTPAGWYPDPSGGPGQRYWDGQEWAPETPQRKMSRGAKIAIAVAVIAGVATVGSLIATKDNQPRTRVMPPPPPSSALITPPTVEVRESDWVACKAAPSSIVALINGAFTDGEQLIRPVALAGPDDVTYIAGDIARDGKVLLHANVWLAQGPLVFALSSGARKRTVLPDGRDFWSAGDEFGTKVQDCIQR